MIHFLPEPDTSDVLPSESAARLSGLGHALAAVQALGGTAPDGADHAAIAAAWPAAGDSRHDLFETLSARAVAGSVAGLEAIAALRDAGLEANRAAIDTLTHSIRGEIDRLGLLLSL
jgi:hypothetical protein